MISGASTPEMHAFNMSPVSYLPEQRIYMVGTCRGLTWQAAKHHTVVHSVPLGGMGRELEKKVKLMD